MVPARRQAIHDAMVRLHAGDRSAFDGLLQELWPVVLSFARQGAVRLEDAEDVAQEVFLKICSRIPDFDPRRDALSWAFGIASYEIMTHRKKRQRRREALDPGALLALSDTSASQEDALLAREVQQAFAQMLVELSDEERAALGLSHGAALEAASPALRKRKQRTVERLRQLWRSIYGEP